MNTILSTLVSDAYRESNITNINSDLTDAQLDEGMRLLVRVIGSVYGNEAGENLLDFPLGNNKVLSPAGYPPEYPANFYMPLNTRAVLNYTSAQQVLLHPYPQDGSRFAAIDENSDPLEVTINANGRLIEGNDTYLFNEIRGYREWIFNSQTGNWNVIAPLMPEDPCPFPPEFDDLFVIGLSMRLNPRYTQDISPQSLQTYKDVLRKFKARYSQRIETGAEPALVLTSGVRRERGYYYGYYYGNATDIFNRGYPYIW